jgi:hypothetical protein
LKEKAQGNEIRALEEALPTKQATKINPSKLSVQNSSVKESSEEESPEELPPEEKQVPENNEISINYVST